MKFITLTLFVCFLLIALVTAVPADESILGDTYGDQNDQYNPEDPKHFLKFKKFKKLLLG